MGREIADGGRAARQSVQCRDQVGGEARRIEAEVLDDAQHVGVLLLQELVQPVDDLDVGVAAHLAENGGGLDGFVAERIEFAEECGAFDFSHIVEGEPWRTRSSASWSKGLVLSQVVQPSRPALPI